MNGTTATRKNAIRAAATDQENQSPKYANFLQNPMIITNPVMDDARFTRGHGKFDDTYYESRVCSLSKTRAQRQTMFEDITNISNRNPT